MKRYQRHWVLILLAILLVITPRVQATEDDDELSDGPIDESNVTILNKTNFDTLIKSSKFALVREIRESITSIVPQTSPILPCRLNSMLLGVVIARYVLFLLACFRRLPLPSTNRTPSTNKIARAFINSQTISKTKINQDFRPKYAQAASAAKVLEPTQLIVGNVDCDAEEELSTRFEIEHFPTIKWFENGQPFAEYNGELGAQEVTEWIERMLDGGTQGIEDEAGLSEVGLQDFDVAVVGYFTESEEASQQPQYTAYRKFAATEEGLMFFRTSNLDVAKKIGMKDVTDGNLVLVRHYAGHPAAVVEYSGHAASRKENATWQEKYEAFYHAEKLPDWLSYEEQQKAGGKDILSVAIEWHMYVALRPEYFNKHAELQLRKAASALRGKVCIMTSTPDAHDEGTDEYPVAKTFEFDPNTTRIFAGVVSRTSYNRYTCLLDETKPLDAAALIACGQGAVDGTGHRMYHSEPLPESPKVGNVTLLVGSNFDSVARDPTKDVLVMVYAPWCGHCRQYMPTFIRAAAALATYAPEVVVARVDGAANEFKGLTIEGYPTLLWFGKNASDAHRAVDPLELKELVEFVVQEVGGSVGSVEAFEKMDLEGDALLLEGVDEEEDGGVEGGVGDGGEGGGDEYEDVEVDVEGLHVRMVSEEEVLANGGGKGGGAEHDEL